LFGFSYKSKLKTKFNFRGKVPADVYIRSGNPDYNLALNKTVSNFTIHPKFKAANLEYDAAMLVLKTPLTDAGISS